MEKRKKIGRPKGDRVTRAMGVRIEVGLHDRLIALSKETGIPQNQLLCNFLEIGLDLAESPPGRATFQFLRWGDRLKELFHDRCLSESA